MPFASDFNDCLYYVNCAHNFLEGNWPTLLLALLMYLLMGGVKKGLWYSWLGITYPFRKRAKQNDQDRAEAGPEKPLFSDVDRAVLDAFVGPVSWRAEKSFLYGAGFYVTNAGCVHRSDNDDAITGRLGAKALELLRLRWTREKKAYEDAEARRQDAEVIRAAAIARLNQAVPASASPTPGQCGLSIKNVWDALPPKVNV